MASLAAHRRFRNRLAYLAALGALAALTFSAPAAAFVRAAPVSCAESRGPCRQEVKVADRETTYKGLRVRILTQPAPNGGWQAQAEIADQAGPLNTDRESYGSEQEAYTAALSAAMAHVDRSRAAIGKP
jgi:hypothetical protein